MQNSSTWNTQRSTTMDKKYSDCIANDSFLYHGLSFLMNQEQILPVLSDKAIADDSILYLSMFEWVDDATRHCHAEQGLRGLKTGRRCMSQERQLVQNKTPSSFVSSSLDTKQEALY